MYYSKFFDFDNNVHSAKQHCGKISTPTKPRIIMDYLLAVPLFVRTTLSPTVNSWIGSVPRGTCTVVPHRFSKMECVRLEHIHESRQKRRHSVVLWQKENYSVTWRDILDHGLSTALKKAFQRLALLTFVWSRGGGTNTTNTVNCRTLPFCSVWAPSVVALRLLYTP